MTFCLLMPGIPESKPRGKASSVTFQFYTAMKTCIIRWYPHIFRGFNAISAITCRVLTGSCSLGPAAQESIGCNQSSWTVVTLVLNRNQ
jgi:hypothetical protein